MERFMEVDDARHGVLFVENGVRGRVYRRAYKSGSMSFSAFGKLCMGGDSSGSNHD